MIRTNIFQTIGSECQTAISSFCDLGGLTSHLFSFFISQTSFLGVNKAVCKAFHVVTRDY